MADSFSGRKLPDEGELQERIPAVENPDVIPGEEQKRIFDVQRRRAKNSRYEQDSKMRVELSKWARIVVVFWLGFVALTVFMVMLVVGAKLSDTVLSVLLATTTVNVLGLMFIVLYGYFPNDKK